MQFTVPQFIEHEAKIIGPFTFRQFIFIGGAGALCFILYFTLGKTNFLLFLLFAIIIGFSALSLAFLKIGGRPLQTVLKNFFFFSKAPKIYLWRRKETMPRYVRRMPKGEEKETAEAEKTPSLKFAEKSRLNKLSTKIETRI